jgi:inhibitor of KinA sporulation pathway (predicted exonuclease)
MMDRPRYFHVVDFEATCSNDNSLRREEMEIIEVGAVMVDGPTLEVLDEFQSFVRPVRRPVLTAFCRELTSITQADVDEAAAFPDVVDRWQNWASSYDGSVLSSWGEYDRNQLEQDCRCHRLAYPFSPEHINLKAQFSLRLGQRRRFGLAAALARAGLTLQGTHHRGIDDARNIARLLPFILGEKAVPPHTQKKASGGRESPDGGGSPRACIPPN